MDSLLYFLLSVGFFQNAGGIPLRTCEILDCKQIILSLSLLIFSTFHHFMQIKIKKLKLETKSTTFKRHQSIYKDVHRVCISETPYIVPDCHFQTAQIISLIQEHNLTIRLYKTASLDFPYSSA